MTIPRMAKEWARAGFRALGFRVTRDRPANRFHAMDEALALMKARGYEPRVILDGGANRGQFATLAHAIFPTALIEMIEPQPACAGDLALLAARPGGRFRHHPVAITFPGPRSVRMIGGGTGGGCTGNYVAGADEHGADEIVCPACTLDELFADGITGADRALLKLDVEGHELEALQGAGRLLAAVEAMLLEVQFFHINGNQHATFADLLAFLRERGFELYDVTSLHPRPRDLRLRMGDVLFVRRDSPLMADVSWA